MSAHEDDASRPCAVCGVTFDCHAVLSPRCPGESVDLTELASQLRQMHECVTFDSQRHTYSVNGVSLVPVTRVCSTLAKGEAFLGWIAKTTREGKNWRTVGRDEASIGKAVHRTAENWGRRKLGLEPLPEIVSSEAAYLCAGLPAWLDSTDLEPLFQPEIRTFHLSLGYAGSLDFAALWKGHKVIPDLKTCRSGEDCWDEWPLQNAGYKLALEANGLGDDWQGLIIRVPKDGGEPNLLPLGNDDADKTAFISLVSVHKWRNRTELAKGA